MVSGNVVAVVTDDLEAANYLANGKEADALGGNDAASNKLSPVHTPDLL